MVSEPQVTPPPDPRTEAGPVRRALHLTVAGVGWVVFAWWWWLVIRRTSGAEVAFTMTFLALSLVVVVVVTALWVVHNVGIFRRKGARRTVRERISDPLHDTLGRDLKMRVGREALHESPVVRITLDGERKTYQAADAGFSWAPARDAS